MTSVRPKKQLGQHFLADKRIAQRIVNSLDASDVDSVVEIGPGMGVLTGLLLERLGNRLWAVEVDGESVEYLSEHLPALTDNLLHDDFLDMYLDSRFGNRMAVIGNLPYNISSQIFFRILDNRNRVVEVVAMVQREVARRIAEKPGSKTYGILSVMLQAYYRIDYLFTVNEGCFIPPPRVKSAVIRLIRNSVDELPCNHSLFVRVVKAAFNQRRKTLRNAMRAVFPHVTLTERFAPMRAEQLSVDDFVALTNEIAGGAK